MGRLLRAPQTRRARHHRSWNRSGRAHEQMGAERPWTGFVSFTHTHSSPAQQNPTFPSRHMAPSLHWVMLPRFSASRGSRLWHRVIHAWRLTCPALQVRQPENHEEVLNVNLWWTSFFFAQNFGFTLFRARQLSRSGLNHLHNILRPSHSTASSLWATSRAVLHTTRWFQPLSKSSWTPAPGLDNYNNYNTEPKRYRRMVGLVL